MWWNIDEKLCYIILFVLHFKQLIQNINFRDEEEQSLVDFCSAVATVSSQFTAIIDMTWNGWDDVAAKAKVLKGVYWQLQCVYDFAENIVKHILRYFLWIF